MRLDTIRLRRFDQRVQASARRGAGGGLTDRVLDSVCIERDLRMVEERQELTPLRSMPRAAYVALCRGADYAE
jgi:hypothetical protein